PVDADPGNNLVPIAPVPKATRRATTKRQAFEVDLSGATPGQAFDPRPTLPQTPLRALPRSAAPGPPPPPPPPPPPEPARLARSLGRAAVLLAQAGSAEALLAKIGELALELAPARQASVFLAQGGVARRALVVPASDETRASSALMEEVMRTGEAVSVQDLKQDARWGTGYSVLSLGLRGAIGVPLLALGKPRGVLYVDEPRAVAPEEREEAIALLAGLGAIAGLALVASGAVLAGDEERAAAEAARAARVVAESLPRTGAIEGALRIRVGNGAFAETVALPMRRPGAAGRHEVAILCGLATGSPLVTLRVEAAARAAFRALAASDAPAEGLLAALTRALEPALEGKNPPLALLRVDPASGAVAASLAGFGPLLHRSKAGDVFAIDSPCEEQAIEWSPGDLLLLAAPAPADVRVAPWLAKTTAMRAAAALERSSIELPEAALLLALVRA
ncbi:MAG TPA: GAF domain-containing protein, partial [Planctomycetota bacterium]|nr:GAF domain-containing protein [Planctomycetota bacterium]